MAIVWCMMYKLHVRQQLWNFQVRNDADLMVHSKKKHFFHSIFSEKKGLMERIPKRQTFLLIHARVLVRASTLSIQTNWNKSARDESRVPSTTDPPLWYTIACFTPLASIFHIKTPRFSIACADFFFIFNENNQIHLLKFSSFFFRKFH